MHEWITLHIVEFGFRAVGEAAASDGSVHEVYVIFFARPDEPTFVITKYSPLPKHSSCCRKNFDAVWRFFDKKGV